MKSTAAKTSLRLANLSNADELEKFRKSINRSRLVNLLNRINFRDGEVNIHFRHNKYNHVLTIQAKPQICNNDYLRCLWSEHFDAGKRLKHFNFTYLTFSDGLNQIQVPAQLIEMNEYGVYLELPESSFEIKYREIKRHRCTAISAQINQDGMCLNAELTSFSAQAFALSLLPEQMNTQCLLDPTNPVHVVFKNGHDFIFSGTCQIIRQNTAAKGKNLVLQPVRSNIQLFRPKEVRSERVVLNPMPNIIFKHPLTRQKGNLSLIDISGTGFAVSEDEDAAVLMPGMILPELEIEFVHGFSVKCRAQVVYRLPAADYIKCGVAILDMNMKDHIRLSSYLHQAKNKHSSISSTNVDLDALWDFFFESGFVYPDKYVHIIEQKERFKELYRKLYNECPEIARHVIYQDKGKIYGHVAMFRYYRNTWLMHHHAAIKSPKHKAGLVVMEHILQYVNECHPLASAKMKYIACYFRPNNRFANRVFGGAARALEDQKKCSLDDFAYFHFEPDQTSPELSSDWSLGPAHQDDLQIVHHWYNSISGGLMIKGLDLGYAAVSLDRKTNGEYRSAGYSRARDIFSLKWNDELIALFVVNRSDLGMNMSDLTNCIQAFILDHGQITGDILTSVFSDLSRHFEQEEVPVLLYPDSAAKKLGMSIAKTYSLTVLDLEFISPYLLFMHSLMTQKDKKVKHIS